MNGKKPETAIHRIGDRHWKRRGWFACLLLLIATISGCGIMQTLTGNVMAAIDYADVACFDGVTYERQSERLSLGAEGPSVGPVEYTVERRLQDEETNPNHVLQDGEAGLQPIGTEFHSLEGYAPSFRLVVEEDGYAVLYEAGDSKTAKVGADLLDIRDKVDAVELLEPSDERKVVARIEDVEAVNRIVSDLLEAAIVAPDSKRGLPTAFLALRLKDGTSVVRAYWVEDGSVHDQMKLSEASREMIAAQLP